MPKICYTEHRFSTGRMAVIERSVQIEEAWERAVESQSTGRRLLTLVSNNWDRVTARLESESGEKIED
jgi:hypothetical protein